MQELTLEEQTALVCVRLTLLGGAAYAKRLQQAMEETGVNRHLLQHRQAWIHWAEKLAEHLERKERPEPWVRRPLA